MKEICICAAIKVETDKGERIQRCHRHHEAARHINWMWRDGQITDEQYQNTVQGFVTSKNRFVDRYEGMKIQKAAGIKSVDRDGYRGEQLFSEDLY